MESSNETVTQESRSPSPSNEWQELRGHARHQTVEVLRLILILVQDAVILVAGFAAEFVYEHWLHSEHPFFQLATNLSSAFFLLLYVITVTVHVVQYVRGQVGATKATRLGEYLPWAIIGGGVLAAAMALTVPSLRVGRMADTERPVSRVTINLPAGQHLAALDQPAIAISPDGKNLVYVAIQSRDTNPSRDREGAGADRALESTHPLADARGSDSAQRLYLRPLDSLESKPIAGTEGAVSPFFSPDGQWIGFFAGGKLKKVSIHGGSEVALANAPIPRGASWGQRILALQVTNHGLGLQQISQDGGTPQPLTRLTKGEVVHRWPEFLPSNAGFVFAPRRAHRLGATPE